MKESKLLTLKEFCSKYKLMGYRQMQRYIQQADANGAAMWIRRVGRKIYVDVDQFFEWTKRKA